MADIPTLEYSTSPRQVWKDFAHTQGALNAFSYTQHLAPRYDELFLRWEKIQSEDLRLQGRLVQATAFVGSMDLLMNGYTRVLDKEIRLLVRDNRKAPLYRRIFGRLTPSQVRKLSLPKKIDFMESCLSSLSGDSHPELQELGQKIEADTEKSQGALSEWTRALALLRDFGLVGDYKVFIDFSNAVRKGVFGELLELRHARPDLNLPPRFAYSFFLSKRRRKRLTRDEEIALLQRTIPESEKRLAFLQGQAEEESQTRQAAEAQAIAEALAKKQAARDAIDEEIAQLKKKRGKLK